LKCLEEAVKRRVPYEILRLIVELRGKDILYIEHRDCVRVAVHLQTVCNEAGYETVLRVLKKDVGSLGREGFFDGTSTDSLKQLVVGYQLSNRQKPLYIAIPGQEYPVDVKMAWNIIKGEAPSNVEAVKKKFQVIEEKVDQLCKHLGESGGIEVQLVAPVDESTLSDMTGTMQKVTNRNSNSFFSRRSRKDTDKKNALRTHADYVRNIATEFSSAVFEMEGFTSSIRPVRRHPKLLGISLFKTNTIFERRPFWLELGIGRNLRDLRITRFSKSNKQFWVYMLGCCRYEMAWNIWQEAESESREKKVPKNYVSISDQRRVMKAHLMALRSKNQHNSKREEANRSNTLDLQRMNENVNEDEKNDIK